MNSAEAGSSVVERIAKINTILSGLAALVGASAWFQPSVAGSDLWWHLAAGREIVATGSVPTVDHFSFTFSGRPWMHHEWLWGTGYWLVYRISPEAVALVNLALLFAVFGVAWAVALRHCGSRLGAGLALWAAAATSYWFLDIRPHEVTLLFVGVVLLTRQQPFARWLWAPLMVLWCNLHGGFVFGFGAIGLFVAVETLENSLERRRLAADPTLWLGLALAGLAFLCNPWGWHILEYPAAYLNSDSPFRAILEWQPPPFDLDPRNFSGRFFWLLAAVLAGGVIETIARVRGGRRAGDLYLIALAAVTSAMALTSRRFIPLFALTSLPLAARSFATASAALRVRLPPSTSSAAERVLPALALAVGLLLWRDVRLFPNPLERWTEYYLYPRAGLRYLQALGVGSRILNYYNWGGFIWLHAPQLHVLIDGRANTLYDERTYDDYVSLLSDAGNARERLAIYAPDSALLPIGRGSLAAKLASQYGWQLVYTDNICAVLLPPGSPRLREPLPNADEVLRDEPDWQLARASGFTARGQPAAAREIAEAVIAREPLAARAYGELADAWASERNLSGIATAIARGIDAEPRFEPTLRQFESAAYRVAGQPALALAALQRGIPRGPFSRPEGVLQDIQQLEAGLASR